MATNSEENKTDGNGNGNGNGDANNENENDNQFKTANYVYIWDDTLSWIPAQVVERPTTSSSIVSIPNYGNDEQRIVCDGGRSASSFTKRTLTFKTNEEQSEQMPLQNVDPEGRLQVVEDMVDLPFLHEAAILYNLKARHKASHPYTRTGDIVLAVNPYQWFHDIYSYQVQEYYANMLVWNAGDVAKKNKNKKDDDKADTTVGNKTTTTATTTTPPTTTTSTADPRSHLRPHVYEASCLAYKGLLQHNTDQSILVSGESGAGKTETVKILLGDLAAVQRGPHDHGTNGVEGKSGIKSNKNKVSSSSSTSASTESEHSVVVQRVLDSNPLLEAFGNAQTLRNDNSSRFGKYLQLQFDRPGENKCILSGSKCEVYLLEKSRVTMHHIEERTYHIFYQLLAAPDDIKEEIHPQLTDTDNESFVYVGWSKTDTIEGMTDGERFHQTVDALKLVGIQDETLLTLWRAICIVLQLGNLEFVPTSTESKNNFGSSSFQSMGHSNEDACKIVDEIQEAEDDDEEDEPSELDVLSSLTGIAKDELSTALTYRNVQARSEVFKVPLTVEKAKESTDAFAKEIYARTFLWLVRTINDATCAEKNYKRQSNNNNNASSSSAGTATASSRRGMKHTSSSLSASSSMAMKFGMIGLLDIFGFETFEVNRFEQLCINYANEKLQQKFTQDIFRSVQVEYEMEGIELEEITYDDNTDVLDLVEGRMGLLAFLNEECVRPKGSDKTFVYKAMQMNKDNPCFFRDKHAPDTQFGICHFAGKVVYDATQFVVKNMDTLPSDLLECAQRSTNDILAKELTNDRMMNPLVEITNNPDGLDPSADLSGAGGGDGGNATKSKKKKKRRPKSAQAKAAAAAAQQQQEAAAAAAAAQQQQQAAAMKKRSSNLVADTVWTKFKSQLSSLMDALNETQTRYIRCIKPNPRKQPLQMDHKTTVDQLRCAGVVAAVTISRSAFPNRLEHLVVLERFKSIYPKGDHHKILKDHAAIADPFQRAYKAVEVLLTIALRDLEIQRQKQQAVNKGNKSSSSNNNNNNKARAFVMGKTRTYFRAGALEFLEGERLKYMAKFATTVQTMVRGYLIRMHYAKYYASVIKLQAGHRRNMAKSKYIKQRRSAIKLQCWHRLLHAGRTLVHLRRMYCATKIQTRWRVGRDRAKFFKLRAAAIVIETMVRGALQRPKYRQALIDKKEEDKLENQLRALQRKLEEAEAKRIEAEKQAEARAKAAIEKYQKEKEEAAAKEAAEKKAKEEKEAAEKKQKEQQEQEEAAAAAAAEAEAAAKQEEDEEKEKAASSGEGTQQMNEEEELQAELVRQRQLREEQEKEHELTLEQQKLMDESGKMLEHLRQEVFKLRSQNQQLRAEFVMLKENNQRLMDANASAGASFAALNQHAKQMSKNNAQMLDEVQSYKGQIQKLNILQVELKEELRLKQTTYIAEVQSRLHYQKALQSITDLIQENCRDHRLVEQVLTVADDCETEYMDMGAEAAAAAAGGGGGGNNARTPSKSRGGGTIEYDDDDEDDEGYSNRRMNESRGSIFGYFFGGSSTH